MGEAKGNAARYVASFYAGMESVHQRGIDVPTVERLNQILAKWEVPLFIEPPNLSLRSGDIEFVPSETEEQPSNAAFSRGPEVGRGGFGVVYRIDRKTHIGEYHYAMKVFEPSAFVQNRERALARFKREMRRWRNCNTAE